MPIDSAIFAALVALAAGLGLLLGLSLLKDGQPPFKKALATVAAIPIVFVATFLLWNPEIGPDQYALLLVTAQSSEPVRLAARDALRDGTIDWREYRSIVRGQGAIAGEDMRDILKRIAK